MTPRFKIDRRLVGSHYLFSTVCLQFEDRQGHQAAGTAFFFNHVGSSFVSKAYLVTNRHVVDEAQSHLVRFHSGPVGEGHEFGTCEDIQISIPSKFWVAHIDSSVDVCMLPCSRLIELGVDLGSIYFTAIDSRHILDEASESRLRSQMAISMTGYPYGLWDEVNNLPIQRRGTTASHPAVDHDGTPEVLIDMACFPGSSGSPVVFDDTAYFGSQPRFLGVLYGVPSYNITDKQVEPTYLPTSVADYSMKEVLLHLGYVIKARKLVELARHIEAQ